MKYAVYPLIVWPLILIAMMSLCLGGILRVDLKITIVTFCSQHVFACLLNGKDTNNKVNRWSLELATYNISFEWILGARNKAADCLSKFVTPTSTSINILTASSNDGPAFHTRSHTQNTTDTTSICHPDTTPQISQEPTSTPKLLGAECLDALLQMQRTDPFCKHISRRLLNDKAPHHGFDTFTHVKGLSYKHIMDAGKKYLTLVIPKSCDDVNYYKYYE